MIFNVNKMYVELELPATGENFDNFRFSIEFGALFNPAKNWGDVSPQELR